MIKLVKILNKNNNAPETEIQYVTPDTRVTVGSIFTLCNNYLTCEANNSAHEGEHYYCLESFVADKIRPVKCFRITKDMVFSAKPKDGKHNPGERLSFVFTSPDDGYTEISETGNGYRDIMVISNVNYDVDGTVMFILDKLPSQSQINEI